ncbi:MAG: hypothetical protein ACKO38_10985 [Planctomycetota bacterium]
MTQGKSWASSMAATRLSVPLLTVPLITLSLLAMAGCGGDEFPARTKVTGTVKYKGQPVSGATVTFFSDSVPRAAIGTTDANGRFTLSTFGENDGAVPAEYLVTISKAAAADSGAAYDPTNPGAAYGKAMAGSAKGSNPTAKDELPASYANRGTSGLSQKVSADSANDFTFDLK